MSFAAEVKFEGLTWRVQFVLVKANLFNPVFIPVSIRMRVLTICRQAPSVTPLAIGYPAARYSS
jgi:hypothetical protein